MSHFFLPAVRSWLLRVREAIATRRALARMDDRMLADIGLGRAEALTEASRRFWDF